MNHWRVRALVIGAVLLATVLASGVYLSLDSRPVSAMPQHSMDSHPNTSSGSGAGNSGKSPAVSPTVVLDGSILAVNKATRTVSVKVDLPVPAEAVKDLSTIKPGDPVAVSVRLDGKGRPVVTRIAPVGGAVAFKITGIQCQACADRLQASLKGSEGVTQVTVTANPPKAQISFDPTKTNADALKAVIRNTPPIHPGTPFGVQE